MVSSAEADPVELTTLSAPARSASRQALPSRVSLSASASMMTDAGASAECAMSTTASRSL
jgi:hypothetical protein